MRFPARLAASVPALWFVRARERAERGTSRPLAVQNEEKQFPSTGAGSPAASRILIVIVNYKTPTLCIEALGSLEPEVRRHGRARVVVVDNPSGDDSPERIAAALEERGWKDFAALVCAPVNGGFAYGNNLAIRSALASPEPPEFVWLLNPDTKVQPGALDELVAFLEARPEVGIVGSGLEDPDGTSWPYAFRFPTLVSEFEHNARLGVVSRLLANHAFTRKMADHPERIDWLPGASMMVRREVFERVGLMDEEYFLYLEETDFCLQSARAGFECWRVPASRVMHIAGQSTGVTDRKAPPRRLPAYWFESRARYWLKNHGRSYGIAADLVAIVLFGLWRARRSVQGKPDEDPPHYLADLWRHSTLFVAEPPTNSRLVR